MENPPPRHGPVLIVEDDLSIREALRTLLTDDGYDVIAVGNGRDAIIWLKLDPREPCIVLLDLMMPIMSGWDVLEVIREGDQLITLPVLVVSAAHVPNAPKGITGFLKKPLNYKHLMDTIESFCSPVVCP